MAITSNNLDPLVYDDIVKLTQQIKAMNYIQNNGLSYSGSASVATGTSSNYSNGYTYPPITNVQTPTKRVKEINTGSVLRGINGLLYKIAEMKGQ